MNKQELIDKLSQKPFYIKSSKGNLLTCAKKDGHWFAQGKQVRRQRDIDYLEKEYEKNKKDIEKEYNRIMDDLNSFEIWDSGNLSIIQQEILDYLLETGKVKRISGVPGQHDTFNGTAKWIYTLNETEEDEQKHRLHNKEKSDAAKLAWKRHHSSYMSGTRKRQRNMENRTFYNIAKEMDEKLNETKIVRDNVFDKQLDLSFDTISGGISLGIKNGTVSFSCSLEETGSGSYKLEQGDEEALYNDLKEELQRICQMVDDNMKQILAQHGLKSTK